MGKVLLEQSSVFKAVLKECDEALASLVDCPTWSVITELSRSGNESRVYQSEFSQPLCTALQLGLVTLWRSWGLVPNSVVGHSSGEIAAAYSAGFLSVRDSIIIAYYRGLCLAGMNDSRTVPERKGAMCAVGIDEIHAVKILERFQGKVDLAAVNSPYSCTLSGDRNAIKDIVQLCTREGIFCRELKIDIGEWYIYIMHYFTEI
jgi:acyl transferase domain-containing protein